MWWVRGSMWGSILVLAACSASSAGGGSSGGGSGSGGASGSGGSSGVGGTIGSGGSSGSGGSLSLGGSSGSGASGGTTAGSSSVGGAAGTGNPCSPPGDTPQPEQCGNGLDDDLNGFVDEVCTCTAGQSQPCFGGTPSQSTQPNCVKGTQACVLSGEFGQWGPCQGWSCDATPPPPEICDNNIDDDCDGIVDEGCELTVPVNIEGDCLWAFCPPQAPYAVGCNINMQGGDSRGCVANWLGSSGVYFQEGDQCPVPGCAPFCGDVGHITGTLLCSTKQPTVPLNDQNCPINKAQKFYPSDPNGCP